MSLWNAQSLLRDGKAYTLLPLEAVTVTGPDRLVWLHNITTAPFLSLLPGMSIEGLLLDHSGHILHAFAAADDGESVWLLTDQGRSADLAEYLSLMRFMMRVEIECVPVTAVGLMASKEQILGGSGSGVTAGAAPTYPILQAAGEAALIWEDPWPHTAEGGASYGLSDACHPARNSHRVILVSRCLSQCKARAAGDNLGAQPLIEALQNACLEEAPLCAWEAARIVDRRPRPNTEIIDRGVLPHELDWLRTAVSLSKGCFPGNESVSKIVNMGRPPRRAVFLYLEGPDGEIPAAGSAVSCGGENVGFLTSVGRDNRYGPVALALLKRSVPLDAVLGIVSDTTPGFVASQEMIVSPEGRSSASPDHIPGAELRKARAAMAADQKPRPRNERA